MGGPTDLIVVLISASVTRSLMSLTPYWDTSDIIFSAICGGREGGREGRRGEGGREGRSGEEREGGREGGSMRVQDWAVATEQYPLRVEDDGGHKVEENVVAVCLLSLRGGREGEERGREGGREGGRERGREGESERGATPWRWTHMFIV